ncbi:MAG: efflux RND transporter periplasmic adaptor subunit [Opitutales bacterium]
MKKKVIAGILCSLVAAGGIWAIIGAQAPQQNPNNGKQKKPPLVEVVSADKKLIDSTLQLTGETVATDSVVIKATKEGPINYCPWREGDKVSAGEKLVEIDREVHRAEVQTARSKLKRAEAELADLRAGTRPEEIDQARANVRKWRATLEEARTDYERQKELRTKDFTSQQTVDRARERLDVAKAELANAEGKLRMMEAGPTGTELAVQEAAVQEASSGLALAEAHLDECVITAPFNGVITEVHVRPGDLAVPRSPLVGMYDPASLVVRFSVPEKHSSAMRQGLELTVTLDSQPGQTFSGRVSRVYPQLNSPLRTRTVEAGVEEEADLMPNQFARLTLNVESVPNAIMIPREAVVETGGKRIVAFVVSDGRAERRTIELGVERERVVQVTNGIDEGDRVIVAGNENLKDGASVRIANTEKDSDAERPSSEGVGAGDKRSTKRGENQ